MGPVSVVCRCVPPTLQQVAGRMSPGRAYTPPGPGSCGLPRRRAEARSPGQAGRRPGRAVAGTPRPGRARWSGPRPGPVSGRPPGRERLAVSCDGFPLQRHSPLADPGYGTGSTGHGIMVIPNAGSPGSTVAQLKGDGPGASDKVSDNGSRLRSTQRDAPRHRDPSELR
jgi:hypothetical protein